MNHGDSKHLEYLRDLPSGYLLDLLADHQGLDEYSIRKVLRDRGYTNEEIEQKIDRRRHSRWPRRPTLWRTARLATLGTALALTVFNLLCFYQLLHSNDPYTVPLLFLSMVSSGFGFFLGYKMTTHIYQGGRHQLYCGFPISVGVVYLDTGEEQVPGGMQFLLRIAGNALVGVNITLFPLMVIYLTLH